MGVGGFERAEELFEVCAKFCAVCSVIGVRRLESVDVDDDKGVLGIESKRGGLNAAIAMGAMGGSMVGHDGRCAEECDCVCGKDGSVAMSEEEGVER